MLRSFTCIIVLSTASFVLALPVVSPAQHADGSVSLDEKVKALEADVVALKERISELEKGIHQKAPVVVQVPVSSHLHVRVTAPSAGRVDSWWAKEGQLVKEGDPIVEVRRTEGVQTIYAPCDSYVASIPVLRGNATENSTIEVKPGETLIHLLSVNEE